MDYKVWFKSKIRFGFTQFWELVDYLAIEEIEIEQYFEHSTSSQKGIDHFNFF